jgi:hypothetical protein
MVATFCLRLAFGMIAPLILLDPRPIPPRFFRVQFLVALALLGVAGYFYFGHVTPEGLWLALVWSAWACFASSVIWHTDKARGGKACVALATLGLAVALFLVTPFRRPEGPEDMAVGIFALDLWRLADNFASAAFLGITITAMLLGHSYLISPAMTIAPLRRLLIALFVALALRVSLAFFGLWQWTAEQSLGNLETETLLWLATRWLLGLIAPLVLGWMAWETARIRSTQSATGILYVVVIVCFLGELMSLLLLEKTGSIL